MLLETSLHTLRCEYEIKTDDVLYSMLQLGLTSVKGTVMRDKSSKFPHKRYYYHVLVYHGVRYSLLIIVNKRPRFLLDCSAVCSSLHLKVRNIGLSHMTWDITTERQPYNKLVSLLKQAVRCMHETGPLCTTQLLLTSHVILKIVRRIESDSYG